MSDLTDNEHPDESGDLRLPIDYSSDFPQETGNQADEIEIQPVEDPLAELRKRFLAEDQQQAEPQPKPDLLQRMTGTLASKKVPTRPRTQANSDQGFGVISPRPASSDSSSQPRPASFDAASQPRATSNGDEIQDDFLEKRLGPDSAIPRWNRPHLGKNKADSVEDLTAENPGLPSSQNFESDDRDWESKVGPPAGRRLDPLYDGAESEEQSPVIGKQRGRFFELPSRPGEERKMLGAGLERQYEVNRYLSYNPKQSWWGQFRGLSVVEQWLVMTLFAAVLVVGGLIIFLYIDSRRPVVGQIPAVVPPEAGQVTKIPGILTEVSPAVMPIPVELELPGGWKFTLKTSTPGNLWAPTTSEWLRDTEIRRVIGIPWNKQIEAVIHTFGADDVIRLMMNNGDKLVYKVATISQVDVQDASVLRDTRPSLAIVLFNAADNKRWVVVAFP